MVKITGEDVDTLDDKSRNKFDKYVRAATSSNWPCKEIHLNMLENIDSSESTRDKNEFRQRLGGSVAVDQVNFGWPKSNKAMKVSLVMEKGEYVLKLKTGMTDQAQTAAMMSSQAAMLRRLGETLIYLSEIFKSLG